MGAWRRESTWRQRSQPTQTEWIASDDLGPWDPLSPDAVAELLAPIEAPWWIGGGWALDLLAGGQSRAHGDVDVLILRRDQHPFRARLDGWDVRAASPPGELRPWPVGETLPSHLHDVWCRPEPSAGWAFQFMIDDSFGDDWLFRRHHGIRRPVASLAGRASRPGMKVLSPDVQLLYKSKGMRDKDIADFEMVLPHLSAGERDWLRQALITVTPRHGWIDRL